MTIQIVAGTGGYLAEGSHASRPAAPAVPVGGILWYYETDTGNLFFWDALGSAYIAVALPTPPPPGASWVVKTANYTVTTGDTGKDFINTGAAGTVVLALPAAAPNLNYGAAVDAAQIVEFLANTGDVIRFGALASAATGNIQSNQVGAYLRLSSPKAGVWYVTSDVGLWTIT